MKSSISSLASSAYRHLMEDAQSLQRRAVNSACYHGSVTGFKRHWNEAVMAKNLAKDVLRDFQNFPYGGQSSDTPSFSQ